MLRKHVSRRYTNKRHGIHDDFVKSACQSACIMSATIVAAVETHGYLLSRERTAPVNPANPCRTANVSQNFVQTEHAWDEGMVGLCVTRHRRISKEEKRAQFWGCRIKSFVFIFKSIIIHHMKAHVLIWNINSSVGSCTILHHRCCTKATLFSKSLTFL